MRLGLSCRDMEVPPLPAGVVAEANRRLDGIEREEGVTVLAAVESGSRAWGFPSIDSDYDVRFIYLRRPEWYLSIDLEERRDVIERPIDGGIDLSGWDLRKALKLFDTSKPRIDETLAAAAQKGDIDMTEAEAKQQLNTEAAQDLLWGLINSPAFLFNR